MPLDACGLSGAAAACTREFMGAPFLTASVTRSANVHSCDLKTRNTAADGLIEADRNGMLQVFATFRVSPFGATGSGAKDVAKIQASGSVEIESLKTEAPAGLTSTGL